jgi:hypothetical protein
MTMSSSAQEYADALLDAGLSKEELSAVAGEALAKGDERDERLDRLEDRQDTLEEENQRLQEENQQLRDHIETEIEGRLTALSRRTGVNHDRVAELQSRELEKGAHLVAEHVQPDTLTLEAGRVERFEKDAGTHVRLPGGEDALERGGSTRLAHADLLPIQQLAQLDDDMLASEARPVQLAVKVWQEREVDAQKTRNDARLWKHGSGDVREYLDGGELATWIRVEETGVSKEYAQKLASRTIDALKDLTKGRTRDELRNHRKDGLSYKERRLILPAASAIPGETGGAETEGPQTAGVAG